MSKRGNSYTKLTESGAFIRTVIRKDGKRHQNTKRITKNQKKVVLGFIGEFEVYVYPYDYPETVFIGKFPVSTSIDKTNVHSILGVYNRIRWFIDGEAFREVESKKGVQRLRQHIVSSYDEGLKTRTSSKRAGKI